MIDPPADTFASNMRVCYEVLLYLASRMAKLQSGDVFEFVTGDSNASEEIPSWCELRGYTLLSAEALSGEQWRFLIRK